MGATLAPLIIATDKTQLTQFTGGKSAYPVYLTLGNLPKSVRRKPSLHACVLLGYLSVDKITREKLTQQEQRARNQRLFHESMRVILEPLLEAGKHGVEMTGGDGATRKVFPIIAAYVADYPEQCLVTCSKYGTCPKCRCPASDLGNPKAHPLRTQAWTLEVIQEARKATESVAQFHKICMEQDVSGSVYKPFWHGFPHTDIHLSITPDVLHQLYQGVFKHLVNWCTRIMSAEELDYRIRSLPPAYGARHFKNGISALSQISGTERKQMAKILLGCLVGVFPKKALLACRSLLDFIYLAQYSTHDDITLGYLQDALDTFQKNKSYFIDTGVREDMNIPKFHSLMHYIQSIRMLGTTDNYNTEMFERLHIDFAKEGWRASNHRDEFPQMTLWLSRQEKMAAFQNFITWKESLQPPSDARQTALKSKGSGLAISLPKFPTQSRKPIAHIEHQHHAPGFSLRLKEYLNSLLQHSISNRNAILHSLPFDRLDIYHTLKFHPANLEDGEEECDVLKAVPSTSQNAGRFDTAVILHNEDAESTGLEGETYTSLILTDSHQALKEHVLDGFELFSNCQNIWTMQMRHRFGPNVHWPMWNGILI